MGSIIFFLLLDLIERHLHGLAQGRAAISFDLRRGKIKCILPIVYGFNLIIPAKADDEQLDALRRGVVVFEFFFKNFQPGIHFVNRFAKHGARTVKHKHTG